MRDTLFPNEDETREFIVCDQITIGRDPIGPHETITVCRELVPTAHPFHPSHIDIRPIEGWTIERIQFGMVEQLAMPDSHAPSEMFGPRNRLQAPDTFALDFQIIAPGLMVTVKVTNQTDVARPLFLRLIGHEVTPTMKVTPKQLANMQRMVARMKKQRGY